MTEKQIIKSIKALARGECANYQNGMCLETDQRCHLINPRYDSIRDGMIDCDYFRMLDGDVDALNSFNGEYMKQYSWAEMTAAELYFRES